MAKFKNPDTDEIIEVLTVRTSFKDGEMIYKDKYGKQLLAESGKPLEFIPREKKPGEEFQVPVIHKFNGGSGKTKQSMLQQRSRQDYKKNVEEKKRHDQGQAMEQLKNIVTKK